MAEDEATNSSGNPFDAHTSGRDPFPPFEVALADEEAHTEQGEGALNWSIDTLAELKPVEFSPLPQQKEADASGTTHRAISFFEDETQFNVLQTPLSASRPTGRSRAPLTLTPTPLELHRRCRETITRCEARLRERQRKMDKLQAVLPPPTPKRSPRQPSVHQRVTPPSRSTPPRPAKRNRLSATNTPISEWKSPGMRAPMWSASPIVMTHSRRPLCVTPAALRFGATTPSPLMNTPSSTTPKQGPKLRLSFGLSPITFTSPEQAEERSDEEKPSNEDTLPLSSTDESAASESEKENVDRLQAQGEGGRHHEEASSSHADSSSDMMLPTKSKVSVPQRQQAFMEAMEAEARTALAVAPPSSVLSLYHDRRR